MELLLVSVHIVSCILLIILVLLQQGKGAEAGATLGGGDNSSLFGPVSANPLHNVTTLTALVFMVTSLSLAYMARFPSESEQKFFKEGTVAAPLIDSQKQDTAADVLNQLGATEGAASSNTEAQAPEVEAPKAETNLE